MQKEVGAAGHFMFAQIGDDKLLPAKLVSSFDAGCEDGMAFRSIAADDDDKIGLLDVVDRSGIAAVSNGAKQADSCRRLAVTRAVVHVIGADDGAGELLHQVAFFVGAFRRRDEGERIGPGGGFDLSESARNQGQRLVPGGFAELSIFANQWAGEAIVAVDESPAEFAFDAGGDAVRDRKSTR